MLEKMYCNANGEARLRLNYGLKNITVSKKTCETTFFKAEKRNLNANIASEF